MAIKILIVDDDRYIQNMMVYGLSLAGGAKFDIEKCRTGRQAVNRVLQNGIGAVIMDIRMPDMNGIEAGRRIREFSDTPIIFLTAFSDRKTREKAALPGITHFLVKPVDYQKLAILITKLVSKKEIKADQESFIKYRRLAKLKEQQAYQGVNTPPEIILEIEDLESEIKQWAQKNSPDG